VCVCVWSAAVYCYVFIVAMQKWAAVVIPMATQIARASTDVLD